MSVIEIYRAIYDKTRLVQPFICGILGFIFLYSERIGKFIRQFSIHPYLKFIILCLFNYLIISVFIFALSCIIYLFQRHRR